jgi:hypothetical protein
MDPCPKVAKKVQLARIAPPQAPERRPAPRCNGLGRPLKRGNLPGGCNI